jgi:hypothetical protein
MESLDSVRRATDGAASLEALVADKLEGLSEQFPVAHLKMATQHARDLVEPSDSGQAFEFVAPPVNSGSDEEDENNEAKDQVAPAQVNVKAHAPKARMASTQHVPSRVSPTKQMPSLAMHCAQPGKTGTTRLRNPAMATRRSTRSERSRAPTPTEMQKMQKLGKTSMAASTSAGGGSHGRGTNSNRRASVVAGVAGAWKRAGNAVRVSNALGDTQKNAKREAKEKAVMHVASSRQMKRWHPKNWYFLLLEVGWAELIAIFCAIYAGVWCVHL